MFANLNLANYVTVACDATVYGSLRYNTTSGKVVFCNGTAWVTIGNPPLGSSIEWPATSCASIVASRDYTSVGPYWIQQSNGMRDVNVTRCCVVACRI